MTDNPYYPFNSFYSSFIYKSRYSRWLEEEKRRENWDETVNRYLDFIQQHLIDNYNYKIPNKDRLFNAIYNLEVMPSMRALMTAGKALARDNVSGYNCSYLPIDDIKSFDEAMYILLCGTGVGFSVERQYIQKLPEVPDLLFDSETTIVIKDSKEGWAKAFRQLISLLYAGEIPKWDVSRIRPAGARLKTFGGRASGPEPLVDLFRFTIDKFKNAKGKKLTSLECHDILCKIGEIVVVGGVRRSAMISLSNLSDDRMRRAKQGNWWEREPQRALSNNSVAYSEKPEVGAFMEEWLSLYQSKSGERGIFNRVASQKQAARNGRRKSDIDFGTNPCCVSRDTLVLTNTGYIPISDLVDKRIKIWNGENWADVIPYSTGETWLNRVHLSDGNYLDCTDNHRWCVNGQFITTENLTIGMKLDKFDMPVVSWSVSDTNFNIEAYSQGFYAGDGNRGYTHSYVYEPKYCVIPFLKGKISDDVDGRVRWLHGPMLDKSWVPVNSNTNYKLNWLAGLLDADGTVTRDKNGNGFQVTSIDHDFLNQLRLMLTTLGVRAKVVSGTTAGQRLMPNGKGGLDYYSCKETKRILIGNYDSCRLMKLGLNVLLNRLYHNEQEPQRDARQFVKVIEIEELDRYETTYCFTESKTSRGTFNGIVTGNSEIILRPYQFCNLTEVVVRADDDVNKLKEKVSIATELGTYQSTLTYFPYLRKIWSQNTEEERLLGVSLTGIMDNIHIRSRLKELKQEAIDTNSVLSLELGINQSTAITCVKPSGTVSQLVDSASGIHPRHSPYYIRSVRADNKDPLTQFMKDAGIPNEPEFLKPDQTTVFYFPIKSPEKSVYRNNITALEHLELWKRFQEDWCEHKPSITISVKDKEWPSVGAWVYDNFDIVSGVSFLPYDDHTYRQAPYQECTQQEYEKMLAKMPKQIDWDKLSEYEKEDSTIGMQTYSCSGDSCEIVDLVK